MAPKRSQPSDALASGTAFRIKKQKSDNGSTGGQAPPKKHLSKRQQPLAQVPEKRRTNKDDRTLPMENQKTSTPKSILKKKHPEGKDNKAVNKGSDGKARTKKKEKSSFHEIIPSKPPKPSLPSSLRIIVGSYERLLFGFQVTFSTEGTLEPTFHPIFSFAAHTSCISAVAAAGQDSKWLATGAGDETVRVWDLRKRKEVGGLTGHGGTIQGLSFPMRTHLLSSDSSGLINLYRTRDWALLKTLRGHTGRVNACDAHPSGKVALSVGKDGMLRMWDLMRGKGAGAVRLHLGQESKDDVPAHADEPLDVLWSSDGSKVLVMARTEVAIFQTDMSKIAGMKIRRDDPKHKVGCVAWLNSDKILVGNERGEVNVYGIDGEHFSEPLTKLIGHENRVKGVKVTKISINEQIFTLVITSSSDGKVRIFDVTFLDSQDAPHEELHPVATHSTGGARLTCLAVVGGSGSKLDNSEEDHGQDDDSDVDDDDLGNQPMVDQDEMDELNDLLDIIDEARAQGLDVAGLSEFEDDDEFSEEDMSGDEDSSEGAKEDLGEEEEEEEEEEDSDEEEEEVEDDE